MNIRLITEDDIPELSNWFRDISWDYAPVKGQMPEHGFIACVGKKMIACAWLYTTGTAFGKIAYTCTNPDATHDEQTSGLKGVIDKIKEAGMTAKKPITQIEILTKSDAFAQVLKSIDFRIQSGWMKGTWVHPDALSQSK